MIQKILAKIVNKETITFSLIGLAGIPLNLALYSFLSLWVSSLVANAISWTVGAIVNTAANRRITFKLTGTSKIKRHYAVGLVAFVLGLLMTSSVLYFVKQHTETTLWQELILLCLAIGGSTIIKYLLLRFVMKQKPPLVSTLSDSLNKE